MHKSSSCAPFWRSLGLVCGAVDVLPSTVRGRQLFCAGAKIGSAQARGGEEMGGRRTLTASPVARGGGEKRGGGGGGGRSRLLKGPSHPHQLLRSPSSPTLSIVTSASRHHHHQVTRTMSSNSSPSQGRTLTLGNMNPNIKRMEYAVRGPLVIRAVEIEKELAKVRREIRKESSGW